VSLRVHHLAVLVRDLARAEHFYVDVLGCEVERRWGDDRGAPRSVWVTLGPHAFLALELCAGEAAAAAPRAPLGPGWHCVALGIERAEREAWRARLGEHGVRVERESEFTLYIRDPDGNLLALSHWPDAVPS